MLRPLQAQSIGAQAVEAMFAVRLADIHAKQGSLDRTAALLQCTDQQLSGSAPAQLCIAAHAAAVRALASQLGGNLARAVEHCQAGIRLASQAAQQAGAGAGSAAALRRHSGLQAEGAGRSPAPAALDAGAYASSACCASGAPCADDASAAQLAQLHIRRAECLQQAGDAAGARLSLQDARDVCRQCSCIDGAEAFPLHTAAVLYQEALIELQDDDKVDCSSYSSHAHVRQQSNFHCVWPCNLNYDTIRDRQAFHSAVVHVVITLKSLGLHLEGQGSDCSSLRHWYLLLQIPPNLHGASIHADYTCHAHRVPGSTSTAQFLSTTQQTCAQERKASSW